jgi:hypothetical protein
MGRHSQLHDGAGAVNFPEDAARFTAALDELGFSQASFVRFLLDNGDPRKLAALQRQIGRFARGERSVSGEMWVLLKVLRDGAKKAEAV